MCLNMCLILFFIWHTQQFSAFFLFYITFIFLFIGGRFWGNILDRDLEIQVGTFFHTSYLSNIEWKNTLLYVITFMYASTFGYLLNNKTSIKPKIGLNNKTEINSILKIIGVLLGIITIYNSLALLKVAYSSSSYLSLYAGQTEGFNAGGSLINTLLYVFFGFAMSFGNSYNQRLYLIVFFVSAIISIMIGSRGALGAILLFSIWLYNQKKQINLLKLASIGALSLVILLFLASVSIRGADKEGQETILAALSVFFHQQGISLAVFAQSMDIDYPIIPYFQSIIPGFSAIYSLITGTALESYEVSFNTYLSYYLNPTLYERGNGLGWTIMSDMYCYSQGNILIYTFLSLIFGYLSRYLENNRKNSLLCGAIYYAIFMRFLILPRASLSTICPLIIYVIIIFYFIKFSGQLLAKRQKSDG